MSSLISIPVRFALALLTSAMFVSGCSDSGDSRSLVEPDPLTTPVDNPPDPDPVVQNTASVKFDITVPAYVSDALQVQLVWGEKDIAATWVGDEFWTATGDFPTSTSHLLVVKFYDRNGDITLGSYTRIFLTGDNSSESYQISADQFDTKLWDSDNDGVSNINELIAGTGPLVADTVELAARESYGSEALDALTGASGFYESLIATERPYYVATQEAGPVYYENVYSGDVTHTVSVDIDESGTGSFSDRYQRIDPTNDHRENKVATRTNTGNSIVWMGMDDFLDSSAGLTKKVEFNSETRMIGGQTRRQDGVIDRETRGDVSGSNTPIHITYDLTGTVSDDSPNCELIAGTVVHDSLYVLTTDPVWTATEAKVTITKATSDQYWTVSIAALNSQVLEEFLVQSIDATIYCDFGDLR